MLILLLMLLRLINRVVAGAPAPEPMLEPWQRTVSSAVHGLLYVLLVTMPIVGWVANSAYGATTPFFGLFTLPKLVADNEALAKQLFTLHTWAGFLVILLAGMHIGGALFHYVVRRDGVLQRMLPGRWAGGKGASLGFRIQRHHGGCVELGFAGGDEQPVEGERLASHRHGEMFFARGPLQHLQIFQHLACEAEWPEVLVDHAREERVEQVGARVAGCERLRNFPRVDAVGLREPQGFGEHAVVGEHQRLVDQLSRLAGAGCAHVRHGAEVAHQGAIFRSPRRCRPP